MKKNLFLLFVVVFAGITVNAQTAADAVAKNKAFTGAKATKKMYHVIYQLDNGDPKIIEKAIRNINNALKDPRVAGKIEIEVISFSGGTDAFMKGSKYESDFQALVEKGVIVAQCNNTLVERKINPDQIFDFMAIVPSANGELVIRQAEGWAVVKP